MILSCSLTPRKIIPHVVIATLLKRQNAIIPKRIFQERDPYFLQKVRSSVKMPLVNSFSHLYSKSILASSRSEIHLMVSPKCEKVGSIRHLPCTKVSDFGTRWFCVSLRGRIDPPPISKTLVMVQSDPTRTPTQLIRIDVR